MYEDEININILNLKHMEGKLILKTVELGNGFTLIRFDDGEVAFVNVITIDGLGEEVAELMVDSNDKDKSKPDKKSKKEPEEESEEGSEGESYSWGDLLKMGYKELKGLCKDNDLDTNPKDFDKDDNDEVMDFRKEIAEEIDINVPADESEEKGSDKEESVDDDDYTWDDLKAMDFEELEDLCDEQELDTDPKDFDEDEEEKFRKEIAEEMEITVPSKPKKKK